MPPCRQRTCISSERDPLRPRVTFRCTPRMCGQVETGTVGHSFSLNGMPSFSKTLDHRVA